MPTNDPANSTATDQDANWLTQHANQVLEHVDSSGDTLGLLARWRRKHGPVRANLLVELLETRRRASAKFTLGEQMFLTRRGLEQASDEVLAKFKADRFASVQHVYDLCCGVGGDAIGLASRTKTGPTSNATLTTVVDLNPLLVQYAVANVQLHAPTAVCQGHVGDLLQVEMDTDSAWHVDPDRRPQQAKRSDPEFCQPTLAQLMTVRDRCPHGAIKLAPAAGASRLLQQGFELQWLGHRRQCQQQVAWCGSLAQHAGRRVATWLNQHRAETLIELPDAELPLATTLGRYVYEARPNVLAAGLLSSLASSHDLCQLAQGASYLTADRHVTDTDLLTGFEVVEAMPFRPKRLRQQLQRMHAKVVEVKKRGADVQPERLLKQLAGPGDWDAVLIVCPAIGSRATQVIVARRV